MLKLLFSVCFIIFSVSVNAGVIAKENLSSLMTDKIYKKHPNAANIAAENRTHFSQELVKIQYKDGEENFVDYFRPDGHYYVSGHIIAADDMMFTDSKEKLKADFKDYRITQAILVVNPNGAGEEFDVNLVSDGKTWNVLIDKKGNLEKYEGE